MTGYLLYLAIVQSKPKISIRILFLGITLVTRLLWAITLRSPEKGRTIAVLSFRLAQTDTDGERWDRMPNVRHHLT
jgi:hypothetical protein